ncbi:MAG: S41 family peptidase [Ferruginibacter sp.]
MIKVFLTKKTAYPFLIALIVSKSFSQTLTDIQSKRITEFGKVWGLLKYYHPNLATGNFNWNDTLRNHIFRIKACTSDKGFDSLMNSVLENIDSYNTGKKFVKSRKYYTQTFEIAWVSKSQILDSVIKKKLENLLLFFNPKKNYLVVKESYLYDSSVIHNNEKDNLATLIMAWNIIKYEAPHLKLADTNWGAQLEKYIPIVASIRNPSHFEYVLAEMISKIQDSHNFMTLPNYEKELGNYYLPFNIAFVCNRNVIKQIDTTACKNYAIQIGDIIEAINGKNLIGLRDSFRNISRGGHIKIIDSEVDEFYLSKVKENNPVEVIIRSPDNKLRTLNIHPVTKRVLYDPISQKAKAKYYMINDSVSYINLMYSSAKEVKVALRKYHNSKCIIVDNRGYPFDNTYSALFNRLIGDNDRIINYYKQNNKAFTGSFSEKFLKGPYYHLRGFANILKPFYKKYKGKIIVLFDETTLSHAEFRNQGFSFVKNKVVTVGRNTAGADGAIYFRYLPGKIRIAFTGDIVTFPNGESTQKVGIAPNYYIENSINSIRNGEDDILKKAIELASK